MKKSWERRDTREEMEEERRKEERKEKWEKKNWGEIEGMSERTPFLEWRDVRKKTFL